MVAIRNVRSKETNVSELKLLPCPFCGGTKIDACEGSSFRWWQAYCAGCGATSGEVRRQTLGEGTNQQWDAQARVDAFAEWNRRAQQNTDSGARIPEKIPMPVKSFDQMDIAYADGWNNCVDALTGSQKQDGEQDASRAGVNEPFGYVAHGVFGARDFFIRQGYKEDELVPVFAHPPSSPAARVPEGYTLVKTRTIDYLLGIGPNDRGEWFQPVAERPFAWRHELRAGILDRKAQS